MEVKIIPAPSDADIYDLELSDENIAEMKYKDNNAVLHFKQPGDVQLYFIADNDIWKNTEHEAI